MPTIKLLGNPTTYDVIVEHLQNPEETKLSSLQKNQLDRWLAAWTILLKGSSTASGIPLLIQAFPDISQSTAFRDFQNAISLFGDVKSAKKEGLRHLLTEILMDAMGQAVQGKKLDLINKIAANIAEINNLGKSDDGMPDFSQLEPHQYILALTKTAEQQLSKLTGSGVIDLDKLDFEEAKEA